MMILYYTKLQPQYSIGTYIMYKIFFNDTYHYRHDFFLRPLFNALVLRRIPSDHRLKVLDPAIKEESRTCT